MWNFKEFWYKYEFFKGKQISQMILKIVLEMVLTL